MLYMEIKNITIKYGVKQEYQKKEKKINKSNKNLNIINVYNNNKLKAGQNNNNSRAISTNHNINNEENI